MESGLKLASPIIGVAAEPRSGGAFFNRIDVVAGEDATCTQASNEVEVQHACDTASAAVPGWAALGPGGLRLLLRDAAAAMAERTDEFIATMMAEIGATRAWAGFKVRLIIGMLRDAGALTTQVCGLQRMTGALAHQPHNPFPTTAPPLRSDDAQKKDRTRLER